MKHSARLIASTLAAAAIVLVLDVLPAAAQSHTVGVVRDVDYVANADYSDGKDRLDIYIPDGARNAPVIFSIAWRRARGRRSARGALRRPAVRRCRLCYGRHQLSSVPGRSHPAHIQDAAAAFAWVTRNIARHGGDPGRILVSGHSAGAYLAMFSPPIRVGSPRTTYRRALSRGWRRSAASTGSTGKASRRSPHVHLGNRSTGLGRGVAGEIPPTRHAAGAAPRHRWR